MVPETPERTRRQDAIEDIRNELKRKREDDAPPTPEAIGTGWGDWIEEDIPMYTEPIEILNEDAEVTTAEPALMSWHARATSSPIYVPPQEFMDRYLMTPPKLRPTPRVDYTDSPFVATPGSRDNPIVIPSTPKGTEEDPIIIE